MDDLVAAPGFTGSELFIGGTTLFLFSMIFFASGILVTGICTGFMSSIGLGYMLLKLRSNPKGARLWNTMLDNPAVTDLVVSVGFIFILGTATSTGIISGASAAIASSALITFGGKFLGKVEGVPVLSLKKKARISSLNNNA